MSSTIRSEADAEIHGLSSTIEKRKAEMAELRRKRAERRSVLEGGSSAAVSAAAAPSATLATPFASSSSQYPPAPAEAAGVPSGSAFRSTASLFPGSLPPATAAALGGQVPTTAPPPFPHPSMAAAGLSAASVSTAPVPAPVLALALAPAPGHAPMASAVGVQRSQVMARNLSPAPVRRRAANNSSNGATASPPTGLPSASASSSISSSPAAVPVPVPAASSPAFQATMRLRQQQQQSVADANAYAEAEAEADTSFGATDLSTESAEIIAQSAPDESILYHEKGAVVGLAMSPVQQQQQQELQHSGLLNPLSDPESGMYIRDGYRGSSYGHAHLAPAAVDVSHVPININQYRDHNLSLSSGTNRSSAMSMSASKSEMDIPPYLPYLHDPPPMTRQASWESTAAGNTASSPSSHRTHLTNNTNNTTSAMNVSSGSDMHLDSSPPPFVQVQVQEQRAARDGGTESDRRGWDGDGRAHGSQGSIDVRSLVGSPTPPRLPRPGQPALIHAHAHAPSPPLASGVPVKSGAATAADTAASRTSASASVSAVDSVQSQAQAQAHSQLSQQLQFELRRTAKELEHAKLEISQLQAQLARESTNSAVHESEKAALQKLQQETQSKLDMSRAFGREAQEKLDAGDRELQLLAAKLVQMGDPQQRLQQAQDLTRAREQQVQALSHELAATQKQLVQREEQWQQQQKATQSELISLQEKASTLKKDNALLVRQLDTQRDDFDAAQEETAFMHTQLTHKASQVSELERRVQQAAEDAVIAQEVMQEQLREQVQLQVNAQVYERIQSFRDQEFKEAGLASDNAAATAIAEAEAKAQESKMMMGAAIEASNSLKVELSQLRELRRDEQAAAEELAQQFDELTARLQEQEMEQAQVEQNLHRMSELGQLREIDFQNQLYQANSIYQQQLAEIELMKSTAAQHASMVAAAIGSPGPGTVAADAGSGAVMTLAAVSKVISKPPSASERPSGQSSQSSGLPNPHAPHSGNRPRGDSFGSVRSTGSASSSQANTSVGILSPPNTARRGSGSSLISTPLGTSRQHIDAFNEDEAMEFMADQEQQIANLQEQLMVAQATIQTLEAQAQIPMQVQPTPIVTGTSSIQADQQLQYEQLSKYAEDLNQQLEQSNEELQALRSQLQLQQAGLDGHGKWQDQFGSKLREEKGGSQAEGGGNDDYDNDDDEALNLPFSVGDENNTPSRFHSRGSKRSTPIKNKAPGSGSSLSLGLPIGSGSSIYNTVAGSAADALNKLVHPARSIIGNKGEVLPTSSTHEGHTGVTPRPSSLLGAPFKSPSPAKGASTAAGSTAAKGDLDRNRSRDEDEFSGDKDEEIYRLQQRVRNLEIERDRALYRAQPLVADSPDGKSNDADGKGVLTPSNSEMFGFPIDSPGVTKIHVRREESMELLTSQSEEANWTMQVQKLMSQPRAVLCLCRHLLGGLPAYMSVLELYIRAVYSVHNPAKLVLAHGAGPGGPPPSGGLAALCVPGNRGPNDNVSRLLRLYAGKEQEMCDDLRAKYKITEAYAVALLADASDGGFVANAALQTRWADQRTSIGAASSGQLVAKSDGDDGYGSERVVNLLRSVWHQACIWTLLLVVAFQMINSGSSGAGSCNNGGYGAVRLTS